MSEENLTDLLERSAERHNVGSPPLDQMLSRSRRARKRRAGFMVVAASVVIGCVIAGTTWLVNPNDELRTNPLDLAGQWKTIEYEGVQVDVPSDWEKSDQTGCGIPVEGWSAPSTKACKFIEGIAFFGTGTFDLKGQPTEIRTKPDGSGYGGYVIVGSLAVAADSADREVVQGVLDSARGADASPINIEGEWVLAALTDAEGKALLSSNPGPMNRKMHLFFEDGHLRATVNCSEITATYTQSSLRDLSFANTKSDVALNGASCNPPPPLADRLPDVRHVSNDNGRLQLHAENWMIVAVLDRVSVEPSIDLPAAEIATYEPTGASNEALAHGTLVNSNGCLVLRNETEEQLILFDATTTTLTFDGMTLNTTDERGSKVSVQVGERLSFAGGNGPVPKDRSRVTIPTACENAAKNEAFYTHGVGMASARSLKPSPLTDAELSVATRVAKTEQAKITGTFVGATALAHIDTENAECPGGRNLHIRLVWNSDANFDHSAPPGVHIEDGPRKALLLIVDAESGRICSIGSKYRDVGASPSETLLYGEWPDPKDS